ncbi:hypothetical protein MAPG_12014 [Magnaporthiopsis poae ATCC 64411]|uniref:Uncharacterized protein n=1 Tax=Magnaporthiopsis poae (strain ATCC 64411 / 73-15) TaxID=644358 RepID=A0A0C4EGN6_MAGP6|nr:hypothetical protein MAPG_12014 [Magnaporthiopsis poae ATCC 64411]
MSSHLDFGTQATEAGDVLDEAVPNSQITSRSRVLGVEEPFDAQPNEGPSRKPRRGAEPRRVQWSAERIARPICFFVDCHREDLFESSKKINFKDAWDRVSARAVEEWPTLAPLLTVTMMANKYDDELTSERHGLTCRVALVIPRRASARWIEGIPGGRTL